MSFKYLLPNAIGLISPSSCFCQSVIPSPVLLASVVTMLHLSFAYCAKHGLSVNICFICLKSFSCSSSHVHGSFFLSNFLSLSVFSESFGRNFAKYCNAPRNDFSSFVLFGDFSFCMASTFSSFGFIPFSSISYPSHLVCFRKNSDFLLLARYPAFSSLDRTSNSFFSCSCLFPRVTTMMSSSHAGVLYSNVRSIFSWKIVGISTSP